MAQFRPGTLAEFEAGLEAIRRSPREEGLLTMIVRRPAVGARELLTEGTLDLLEGLIGDTWKARGSSRTPDGTAHPDTQLTLMNARVIALLARDKDRWPLAGDQLYVDLDLSVENLPTGTRLALGAAVIEVTAQPHTGCHKFKARYGVEALTFVNSPTGKQLRLRGLNAKVVQPGVIRTGDGIKKL
jgi:MOSC domain-containing protein YiiM